MKKRKIISVTGGTGFIGSFLCKKLLAENYQPRILTRKLPKNRLDGMQYAVLEYGNLESVASALSDSDIVIHMAASLFARSKEEFERANVQTTRNIVGALNSLNKTPEKIIYISSLAAGGPSANPEKPITEEIKERPVSFYGKTKLAGETEIKRLAPEIEFTIFRPPIVYGKRDSGLSKIAAMVKKGIMINAGGNSLFSFIYINDLVDAIKTAIVEKNTNGKTYYICENSVYRWRTFIEIMSHAMKVKMPVMVNMPAPLLKFAGYLSEVITGFLGKPPIFNRDKAREASAGNWIAYSGKWERDTNWKGWTSLKEGLKKSFEEE